MFLSETKKKYKTASYTRLSQDDGDKEESNSITNQKELIRDFLNRHEEFILVEEYADDGYSGVNFNRPDFQRLMEDVKAGRIDCIVVKDLSRFGRNYIETGKYLEQIFPYLGVRFIAINDNTDTGRAQTDAEQFVLPLQKICSTIPTAKIFPPKSGHSLRLSEKNGDLCWQFLQAMAI
mgnify:CR=1 FL=1